MKPISVGLVGLGTVAQGTLNVLANNREELARRVGREIQITHVGARRDRDGVDLSQVKVSRNLMDVALDPEVEIFVELIGGCDYASILKLINPDNEHYKNCYWNRCNQCFNPIPF